MEWHQRDMNALYSLNAKCDGTNNRGLDPSWQALQHCSISSVSSLSSNSHLPEHWTALGKCLEAGNATQEIPSDQIFRRSHRSHVARVWSTPRKHSLVQSQESRHQKTKTSGCGLTAAALDTACCARWTPPRVAPASKASRRSLGSHALTPGQFERVQHALQASHKRRCKGSSCRGPSAPSTRAVGQVSQKEHLQSDRRFDPRVKHTFPWTNKPTGKPYKKNKKHQAHCSGWPNSNCVCSGRFGDTCR